MKPNTRIDNFLAKIAGDPDANTAMKPRSPEEYYLNQIAENGGSGGGGGGVLVVHEDETGTLDKTWQEIFDAVTNSVPTYVLFNNNAGGVFFNLVTGLDAGDTYALYTTYDEYGHYAAETANGYPVAL